MRSSLYLVDTSIWVEVFARTGHSEALANHLASALRHGRVATTGIVRFELLMGARDSHDYERLSQMLGALRQLPTADECWIEAGELGFRLRRAGVTLPATDVLIAAVAIREGAVLIHRDRHFDVIAAHAPLAVESYVTH